MNAQTKRWPVVQWLAIAALVMLAPVIVLCIWGLKVVVRLSILGILIMYCVYCWLTER